MSEFEELLEKIQEQKPELTKQDIDDRIKQKIEKRVNSILLPRSAYQNFVIKKRREFLLAVFCHLGT